MRFWVWILAAVLLSPSSARAEWFEVSSDHFVVYTNDSERDVKRFSERLERYHNAVSQRLGLKEETPSPSNRVTVFVARNVEEVRKIGGFGPNSSIAGFYIPRAGGSVAYAYNVNAVSEYVTFSELTLLHEYAHHIMFSNSGFPFPSWFVEGFAEFLSHAQFHKDGSVSLGQPAQSRGPELLYGDRVPIKLLFDSVAYREHKKKNPSYDNFYGLSWLTYHMLSMDPEHSGKLKVYLNALSNGEREIDAATKAFGDLAEFEKKLYAYLGRSRLTAIKLTGEALKPGPISIRKLRPGEIAIMPVMMRTKRGVNEQEAAQLVAQAREIAGKFPDDPLVLSILAETEVDFGNAVGAIEAADRALAIDPSAIQAHIQKGYALNRMVADAKDKPAAIKAARRQFLVANKVEPNNPVPLIHYFRTFIDNGENPSASAKKGLDWALALAPFDGSLRMMVAQMHLFDKNPAETIALLGPIINSPHKSSFTEAATELRDKAKAALAEVEGKAAEGGKGADPISAPKANGAAPPAPPKKPAAPTRSPMH